MPMRFGTQREYFCEIHEFNEPNATRLKNDEFNMFNGLNEKKVSKLSKATIFPIGKTCVDPSPV